MEEYKKLSYEKKNEVILFHKIIKLLKTICLIVFTVKFSLSISLSLARKTVEIICILPSELFQKERLDSDVEDLDLFFLIPKRFCISRKHYKASRR